MIKKHGEKTKGAPSKIPKEGWEKTALKIVLMLIWVGASVLSSQLIIGYLMMLVLGPERLDEPVFTAIFSALSYIIALLLILFVPRKNTSRDEIGLKGLPTWTDIGLAPVGFFVYLILASLIVTLFSVFPWFNVEEAQDVGFSIYVSGIDRVIAFITLVVIAPIAEEIIFRGWLYGKMRGKLNEKMSDTASLVLSIFLVSLLFGILHLQWNVGVNVFAMSVVLCGLREITGTIYSGILLHMIKNGVAFYLLYVVGL